MAIIIGLLSLEYECVFAVLWIQVDKEKVESEVDEKIGGKNDFRTNLSMTPRHKSITELLQVFELQYKNIWWLDQVYYLIHRMCHIEGKKYNCNWKFFFIP